MNYPESSQILEKIKSSKNVLINCHQTPDPDSVSCALAMKFVLGELGINSTIITPDPIYDSLYFLKDAEKIKHVNFEDFDYSGFDLFLILDTSSLDRVYGEAKPFDIDLICIDHHHTNTGFASLRIVDEVSSSTAEMLFRIFKDWKVEITSHIATALLTGIIADTGGYQYTNTKSKTFDVSSKLLKHKADKELIVSNLFRNNTPEYVEALGVVLKNTKLENEFAWTTMDNETFIRLGAPLDATRTAASTFIRSIKGTKFGIVITENEPNHAYISFRAKSDDVDVSEIAKKLGGGGHTKAAGATIEGKSFEECIHRVLEVARSV